MDAEAARRGILSQHVVIRTLLERARETAVAALDGRASEPNAVASVIEDVRTTMEVHRAFEEKVLLPLFEADPPRGLERARRMVDEHQRQRDMLASLHREAAASPELPTLSIKLAFLTSWLLSDMTEEERELPSSLRFVTTDS